MLSCVLLDPKFTGLNPAEDDAFLRAVIIRSTTSFGKEVKPSAPCRKILRRVKDPCGVWQRYFAGKVSGDFSLSKFLLASLLRVSAGICQRVVVDVSGMMSENGGGCMGRFVRYHPITVTSITSLYGYGWAIFFCC
jgi:hypothetical protein